MFFALKVKGDFSARFDSVALPNLRADQALNPTGTVNTGLNA
jgi:hypothetical protein